MTKRMADPAPLFAYPPQAAFKRVVPKNRIYAHAKATRRVQKLFSSEVAQIIWSYKLAAETVNIPATDATAEIQAFTVLLKDDSATAIAPEILTAIDRAIASPIIFEVVAGDRVRAAAAFKRISEADSSKWVITEHFVSPWFPLDSNRQTLPVALNLEALYEGILSVLLPAERRDGESLRDRVERCCQILKDEQQIHKLESRMHKEKQFNRKVDLNSEVKALQREIRDLSAGDK